MRPVKQFVFLLASFCLSIASFAQTADEVINKHLDAIGGKDKIAAIKTVRMENTMSVMGNESSNTIIIVNGKGYRSESEMMGQKMVQAFTDKSGWMINPMAGGPDAQKIPDEQLKNGQGQINIDPFLDYATKGSKAELLGKEKIGDVNAIKVKITDKDNNATEYCFDPNTYYVIQAARTAEMMGQSTTLTLKYSDYKKTEEGWVVPQTTEFDFGGQFSMTMKLKKIELNKDVDMKIFEMPAK